MVLPAASYSGGEGLHPVEGLRVLQAMVELAEAVEQVAGGRRVTVAAVTPLAIVAAGWLVGGGGGECPSSLRWRAGCS